MNGRSDLCNDYIYGRLNGIPLGYLGKKITTKCITYNSEKKNQYIIEVVKEHKIIGADIVELAPQLDPSGVSTILAAKTARSLLILLSLSKINTFQVN